MQKEQVNFKYIAVCFIKFTCFLLLFSLRLSAQNLIYNGSFELYNKRPVSAEYSLKNSQLHYCKGWDACCPRIYDSCGSTDYYIYKANYESLSTVQPKRAFDENAFIGIFLYDHFERGLWANEGPLYREYASGKLINPLIVGQKYKVSLAHTNGQLPLRDLKEFAHDGFGILLSTYHPVQKSDFSRLTMKPQFRTPYLMSDSIWRIMDFEFVADSAYDHITLGNFFESYDIRIIAYNKSARESFIYFDNLRLEPIIDTTKLPEPITLCKQDSVYIENKEKKPVEWWINGEYLGWAVGIMHYYTEAVNKIIVRYYNDYDTTFVYIKNKPVVVLKQEGFLCQWSDKKGFVSFSSAENLSSFYWQLPNEKVFEPKLNISKPGIVSFIYTSPKQCEWHCELETKDTCPEIKNCFFPNAFTPNNDGLNDTYKIECDNLIDYEIRIFNRWGEQIFYSKNPKDEWAGTFLGNKCEIGIYMATLKVTYPSEGGFFKTETQKISINLIR